MKLLLLLACASMLWGQPTQKSNIKCVDMTTHVVCLELAFDGSLTSVIIPLQYREALRVLLAAPVATKTAIHMTSAAAPLDGSQIGLQDVFFLLPGVANPLKFTTEELRNCKVTL